ncbi:hypothetical protein [Streptacidiphilus rugosus]|uniref:hypothetical protein n=1 Tax=Streptacidiphilus rugosus TaxID=405783 RepID=UPI00055E31D3|nr:hypothetical protein [Streptacidiphilus rugosus]
MVNLLPNIRFRAALATAATATMLPLLGACDPGGVSLGNDWSGAQVFVLAKVNGLTTVVGIDPRAHRAEPLAVVPSQSDDDDVLSPRITRLTDGRWMVTIPKKNGHASTVYAVDTAGHGLTGVGTLPSGHTLLGAGSAAVGLASSATSSTSHGQALVLDPASLHQREALVPPFDATLASGGPGGACIAQVSNTDTRVSTLDPARLTFSPAASLNGFQAQALDCASGQLAVGGSTNGATGKVTLHVTHQGPATVVAASTGDIARIASTPQGLLAAVVLPQGVELIRLSPDGQRELGRTSISGLSGVDGMTSASGTEILTHDTMAAAVNLTDGTVSTFSLPGTLLDAS